MIGYLIGETPGGSVGMALEGPEDEVYARMLRLIMQGPAICWQVTQDSPFEHRNPA